MKRLIILGIALLVAVPTVDARRKVAKAGTIENNLFTDADNGIELTIHENWKAKLGKDKDRIRLLLTKRTYDIPSDYIDAPDYTQVPMLTVYLDTTTLGAYAFIDSLMSESFRSKQKDEIARDFPILNERDIVPKKRSRFEVDGEAGLVWSAQAKYMKEIQSSMGSSSGTRVRRSYGGAIAAVKKGDKIILFHVMTEYEFFDPIMAEVMEIIQSLKFADED
jgi:hypothetical protein